MKIFINARFLTQPISGVQRYGIECSRQILKIYPDVEFLTPADIIHHDLAAEFKATVIGKYKGHNWEQIDLPLYLDQIGSPPLIDLANTAPVAYKNVYVTIHDLAFMQKQQWNSLLFVTWYKWLIPRVARKAKHIFTVSNAMRNEMVTSLDIAPEKISITYNAIPDQLERSLPQNVIKENIILSVGSFNPRKNHQKLVEAFLKSNVRKDHTLVIVGDKSKVFKHSGLNEELIKNEHIQILERVSDEELADLYARAKIIASLSAYEGFGIPLLEGLYFGCKVVCSDIPAYKEVYGNYAYFCSPDDIDGVSKLLDDVAAMPYQAPDTKALTAKYNYLASAQTIISTIEANNNQ